MISWTFSTIHDKIKFEVLLYLNHREPVLLIHVQCGL